MKVESEKDIECQKENIYEDPFYYDAPFYRAGMSVNEYRQEQLYLNENVDIFIDGTYVPLWKQKLIRDNGDNNDKNA